MPVTAFHRVSLWLVKAKRPVAYGETKKRREITVTQEGWNGMKEVVKEAVCSSVSDLIEKLGQLRVVSEGDCP